LAGIVIGDVDAEGGEVVAPALVVRNPRRGVLVPRRVGDDDVETGIVHLGADRFAEATHSAGDQCNMLCHLIVSH
jgi:hypothetical protein